MPMHNSTRRGLGLLIAAACVASAFSLGSSAADAASYIYWDGYLAPSSTKSSVKRVMKGGAILNTNVGINYIQTSYVVGTPWVYRASGRTPQYLSHASYNGVSTCFWLQDPDPNVAKPSSIYITCRQEY
jgi:hypothetical protein